MPIAPPQVRVRSKTRTLILVVRWLNCKLLWTSVNACFWSWWYWSFYTNPCLLLQCDRSIHNLHQNSYIIDINTKKAITFNHLDIKCTTYLSLHHFHSSGNQNMHFWCAVLVSIISICEQLNDCDLQITLVFTQPLFVFQFF